MFELEREDFGVTYRAALKAITIPTSENEILDARAEGMDEASIRTHFSAFTQELAQEFALMSRFKGNSNIVSYENHQVIPHEDGIGWDILIQMELLTPLNRHVAEHGMTRRDVIRLGIDLCRALELCQKHDVIHRDVKPENILVSKNGDYKLGDFGIARMVKKAGSALSRKGTDAYMAPEVYKGEEYDGRADIYSLGLVMYRLLNGNRAPFLPPAPAYISPENREKAFMRRMSGKEALPVPLHADGKLAEIVLKACAYAQEARYEGPAQMRRALEALQANPEAQEAPEAALPAGAEAQGTPSNAEKTHSTFDGISDAVSGHAEDDLWGRAAGPASNREAAKGGARDRGFADEDAADGMKPARPTDAGRKDGTRDEKPADAERKDDARDERPAGDTKAVNPAGDGREVGTQDGTGAPIEAGGHNKKEAARPEGKSLFRLALPLLLGVLAQVAYEFCHWNLSVKIYGYWYSIPDTVVRFVILAAGAGIGVGALCVLSRKLGSGDEAGASRVAGNGLLLVWVLSVFFAVAGFFRIFIPAAEDMGGYLISSNAAVLISIFAFVLLHKVYFECLLIAGGRPGLAMVSMLVGAILNAILSILLNALLPGPNNLVYSFMNIIIPAALMNIIIPAALAAIVGLILNLRLNRELRLRISGLRPSASALKALLKAALPMLLVYLLPSLMVFACFQVFPRIYAASALPYLQTLVLLPVIAMNVAAMTVAARGAGAGRRELAAKEMKKGLLCAALLLVCFSILYFKFAIKNCYEYFSDLFASICVFGPLLSIAGTLTFASCLLAMGRGAAVAALAVLNGALILAFGFGSSVTSGDGFHLLCSVILTVLVLAAGLVLTLRAYRRAFSEAPAKDENAHGA